MKNKSVVEQLKNELTKLRIQLAERELLDIQHKWSSERVRAERGKLDTIINCLPNGLSIISADSEILFQNKWSEERFGHQVGNTCHYKFANRKKPCPECPVKKAILDNKVVECDATGSKDGRFYRLIAAPLGEFDGKKAGVEIRIDITEQKRAEEIIFQSQKKYVDLVNNLNVGVYRNTPGANGRFLDVNPAMISMFEAGSKETFLKHNVNRFYEDHKKRSELSNKLLKLGFLKDEEIRLVTLNDKIFWGAVTSVKREDKDGNVYFEGIVEDITERKKIEEIIQKSEEKWRSLVESAPNIILIVDHEGKIQFINRTISGIDTQKRIDKYIYDYIDPMYHDIVKKTIKRVFQTGEPDSYEARAWGTGGFNYWYNTQVGPIKHTKKVVAVTLITTDITERKKTEEQIRNLNKVLRESNKKLKQLTLRDSHTNLYNFRYLEEIIETEFYRAKRYQHPLSVMFFDIDYFKSINDVYGHPFGDLVLKQLANQFKRIVRRCDTIVRAGGEEFIIICPRIDRQNSFALAQRILDAIRLFNFGNKVNTVKLKLSAAVVSYPQEKSNKGMDLIKIADDILRKAKEDGGDRAYCIVQTKKATTANAKQEEISNVKFIKTKLGKLSKRINNSLIEQVSAFGKTTAQRDGYKGSIIDENSRLTTEIAKLLNLSQDQVDGIHTAYRIHDLGKIGINNKLLNKRSKLSSSELSELKKHPQIGEDIVKHIESLRNTIPSILYHHERWDAKGYPEGLKEKEIPIGARIVAVIDTYQALVSNRPYRKAYPKNQAVKIIKEASGSKFDPQVVNAFLRILRKGENRL